MAVAGAAPHAAAAAAAAAAAEGAAGGGGGALPAAASPKKAAGELKRPPVADGEAASGTAAGGWSNSAAAASASAAAGVQGVGAARSPKSIKESVITGPVPKESAGPCRAAPPAGTPSTGLATGLAPSASGGWKRSSATTGLWSEQRTLWHET